MTAKSHTDREYETKLRELRETFLVMAGRVEEMIDRSIRALVERDGRLAQETIALDGRVNQAEIDIDELGLLLLAKWQPMASDLRTITHTLKMVTDLERIGDLAVNICERAKDLAAGPPVTYSAEIERMATLVRSMMHDAIDSFVNMDAAKADSVIARDDEVDEIYHQMFQAILAVMIKDSSQVERGIHVQSVAKWLERAADHSTNLAENVIFLVRRRDVRHVGKLAR